VAEKKIVEKIRKLLELAKSKANEHEATLAAEMAQDLMLKHKVAVMDLEEPAAVGMEKSVDGEMAEWEQQLVKAAAMAFSCDVLFQQAGSACGWAHLIGRPDDVQATSYLYKYLHRELTEIADTTVMGEEGAGDIVRVMSGFFLDEEAVDPSVRSEEWKDQFKLGAVKTLQTRIKAKARPRGPEGSTALVLQRDAQAVREYMDKHFPGVQTEEVHIDGSQAVLAGHVRGGEISLDLPEKHLDKRKDQLEE
jgi:hypothetical protein